MRVKYKIEMKPEMAVEVCEVIGSVIRSSKAQFNNMLIDNFSCSRCGNICRGELELRAADKPLQFITYHKDQTDYNHTAVDTVVTHTLQTHGMIQFRDFKKLFTKMELAK